MTWVLAVLLALGAFIVLAFVLKAARSGWEAIGAALMIGIAGYGFQASPGLPGAHKPAAQRIDANPAALVDARAAVSESGIPPTNRWVVIADGMARNGQYANAARVLLGAVEDDPKNSEAWLAMGNALVAHADGVLTPASLYAFRHAALADPGSPGPPFFLGLALAQSGRLAEARSVWKDLLERSPDGAPWREDLEMQLERLEEFIAKQKNARMSR